MGIAIHRQTTAPLTAADSPDGSRSRTELRRLSVLVGAASVLAPMFSGRPAPSTQLLGLQIDFLVQFSWVLTIIQTALVTRMLRVILDLLVFRQIGSTDWDIAIGTGHSTSLESSTMSARESDFFDESSVTGRIARACRVIDGLLSSTIIAALVGFGLASAMWSFFHMQPESGLAYIPIEMIQAFLVLLFMIAFARIVRIFFFAFR